VHRPSGHVGETERPPLVVQEVADQIYVDDTAAVLLGPFVVEISQSGLLPLRRAAREAVGKSSRKFSDPVAFAYAGAMSTDLDVSGEAPRDPEELEAAGTPAAEIAPLTTVGAVELSVSDLASSLAYYSTVVGLETLEASNGRASLGVSGRELLALVEEPGAHSARGYAGLFHFALLVPQRVDLARWLAHAARDRVRLEGLSDHYVSEAIYLRDPDSHGIEIYADRPREIWEGKVGENFTTLPLDVDNLLGVLDDPDTEPFDGLSSRTVMGHVHLCVSRLPETVVFYRDVFGFGLMGQYGSQAAFLSAGGYHHHIAANIWESAGAAPAPPGTARLLQADIVLPDTAERDRLVARLAAAGHSVLQDGPAPVAVDPSGNRLVLSIA
jgi:catechol 2,3-dioxygenase